MADMQYTSGSIGTFLLLNPSLGSMVRVPAGVGVGAGLGLGGFDANVALGFESRMVVL